MIATPVKLWRRQKNVASLIGVKGKILNFTIIRVPAKAFIKEAPYPVVIVELENKERMIGQLVDYDKSDLKIGKKVVAVLRRTFTADPENVIFYNIKFKTYESR